MSQTSQVITAPAAWDVASDLPQLLYDGTRYYVYGLDLLYSINPSGLPGPSGPSPDSFTTHLRIDHQDGLGSVRALTDENGTLVGTLTSDALGEGASETGLDPQPFGYSGNQVDSTGLVFLRSRYYDPSVGRFLSRDTYAGSASQPQSLNRYTYVLNSPTLTADPSGMCSNQVCQPHDCTDITDPQALTCMLPGPPVCVASAGCVVPFGVLKNLLGGGGDNELRQLRNYNLAQEVADATGGVLSLAKSGKGAVVTLAGKWNFVIRIMDAGGKEDGFRENYFRISVDGIGSFDLSGQVSTSYDSGRPSIGTTSLTDILRVVSLLTAKYQ